MRKLIVWDTETGGVDVRSCELLSIACLAVDLTSLKVIPGSEFYSLVKPVGGCTLENGRLEQGALNVNKLSLTELATAPERKVVLKQFVEHIKKYGKGFQKPYAGGKNIRTFDFPILERCLKEDGLAEKDSLFDKRVQYDLDDDLQRWFIWENAPMENLKMDTVRTYFGLDAEQGHNALVDVKQTAWLIVKFLKLYQTLGGKINFKDSAKKDGGILS